MAHQEVLHPLSLEVANGEFLTLLGPSGSGKTTVLRLIGGFTEAVRRQDPVRGRGHHRAAGQPAPVQHRLPGLRPVSAHDRGAECRLRAAGAAPRPPKPRRKLVDETLEIVGLSALRDRYPAQLSGGQKQRVALARAIVCEPQGHPAR